MTFRRRLALVSAAAVAVAILLASAIVFVVVRGQLRGGVDSSLEELAGRASATVVPAPGPGGEPSGMRRFAVPVPPPRERKLDPQELALPEPPIGEPLGYGQLITAEGDVLQRHGQDFSLPVTGAAREVARGERGPTFEDAEAEGTHVRMLTVPGAPGEAVQVARSLEDVDATLRDLGFVLGLVSLGGVVLAGILGWLVSRTAIAPVSRLTEAAERVTRTRDLGQRIAADGRSDELGRLANAFDEMLGELDASLRLQRQLVADASHELRTPITSLRTNIEVLARPNGLRPTDRKRLLSDVIAQLGELGALVGDLVELARDEESPAELSDLRLDEVVAEAVERAERNFPGCRMETRLEPCRVRGDSDRLGRAVGNLLDNAAKWSPPGRGVEVTVTGDGEVAVRDHGPGIEPGDLPHVFDRFYRAAGARGMPGSGLGLAIVRQAAEVHGGSVGVEQPGDGGTLMRFSLPAARDRESLADSSAVLS